MRRVLALVDRRRDDDNRGLILAEPVAGILCMVQFPFLTRGPLSVQVTNCRFFSPTLDMGYRDAISLSQTLVCLTQLASKNFFALADLPAQAPTKYELVINLKTASPFCRLGFRSKEVKAKNRRSGRKMSDAILDR
jgi:hypothetical protein